MMRRLSQGYPSYPEIEETLGYNPARFLDSAIKGTECTEDRTVTALIRGIQEIPTIRAWLTVEADLGHGRNGGPRQRVVKWLNRRQAHIEEERSERSASTATTDDREQPSSQGDECPTDHSEPASDAEATDPPSPQMATPSADDTATDTDTTTPGESSTTATAVTDGGAPDPDTPPRCPDCHGPLPEETVAEDDAEAAWCAHCGTMKPLGGPA